MKNSNLSTLIIILLTSSLIRPINTTTTTTKTITTTSTTSTATTTSSKASPSLTLTSSTLETTMKEISTKSTLETTMKEISTSSTKSTLETTNIVPNKNTIKTSTTKQIVTTTLPAKKIFKFQHVINLLGPRKEIDIVFLMARTIGIGKRSFYHEARQLSMALLKQYVSVHPKYARVAYVTFASNSSVDYDDITNNSTISLDKCQLFPSTEQKNLPLDNVVYKVEEETLTKGINGGIEKVNAIFQAGRKNRQNSKQVLFLVMDAQFERNAVKAEFTPSLTKFGIGVGPSYKPQALKALVQNELNSASYSEWTSMINVYLPLKRYNSPLHVSNVNETTCSRLKSALFYDTNSTDCFCDVDYGIVRTKCKKGYVDVFDQAVSEYIEPFGYTRSCKNASVFRNSCIGVCEKNFCQIMIGGNCQDYELDHTRLCRKGGKLIKDGNKLFCSCLNGFYGPSCSINEDDCRFPNLCAYNNTCIDTGKENFKCNCSTGFSGDFCQNIFQNPSTTPIPKVILQPLNVSTSTIVGISIGALIGLAILIGLILLIAMLMRKKTKNRRNYTKKSEMGTSTEASGSVSKWSVKNKSNLSVRLSKLWKQRSFKANDGMPSVPWKRSTQLSQMDLQNVSQEEAILENEVIHDNRSIKDNWEAFMINLVNKNIIQRGLMVNVFTKEIITTEDWEFNWSEVYTLDSVFGTETSVNIQNDDYFLKSPENGVACAKSGSEFSNDEQNLLAVAKTKNYLIAGIVALSDSQDGSECIKKVELIMNHVKSEGY